MFVPEVQVRAGDVIAEKYRVERVLGRGGMGVVVAATQLDLGRPVALKFLLHAAAQGAEVVARFLREARIVGGLRSEHVASVYDLGQLADGAPYMVMEYLEGADLTALLQERRKLPFTEAAAFILQACEALAEAHDRGVIHRDLKPANLFCTRRPNGAALIKVLDFGISKISAATAAELSMTRTSTMMGSPAYMSPEQMVRPKGVDLRTDIWSLGVILYELVTGRAPFQCETLAELALAVHHEEPPPIASLCPDVPADYQAIVSRCLQKDRERRYGSATELARALEACVLARAPSGELVAPAAPASPSTGAGPRISAGSAGSGTLAGELQGRGTPPSRRPPWLVAVLVSSLGLVAAAVGLMLASRGSPSRTASPARGIAADSAAARQPPRAASPVVAAPPLTDGSSARAGSDVSADGGVLPSASPQVSAHADAGADENTHAQAPATKEGPRSAEPPRPSPARRRATRAAGSRLPSVGASGPPKPTEPAAAARPGWDEDILKP